MNRMIVAAVQLDAQLADVPRNYSTAIDLVCRAAEKGAKVIVLPELFTSAIALNPVMEEVAQRNMELDIPAKFLELSHRYGCTIAGSYLNIISGNIYNSMLVQFPDGEQFVHNKDIPTQFENRYYTDGDHTRGRNHVGVALCWEMIRTQTIREMPVQARIVAAGSCWWDLPPASPNAALREYNHELNRTTPVRLAHFLGVPVVHAAHVGTVTGHRNSSTKSIVTRQLIGRTQIVSHEGRIQKELQVTDGNAVLLQEVEMPEAGKRIDVPDGTWIVELPHQYLEAWEVERNLGQAFYRGNRLRMIGDFAT